MPITIQEIIASDTISQLVDKTNFNFDQLLLNGGGPSGPLGPAGPTGPAGGRGFKGTTWYDGTVSPNVTAPTATPLTGDYYLQDSNTNAATDGDVWEYTGLTWGLTGVNLQGPQGSAGAGGGFGELTGAPVFNLANIRYNGPVGTPPGGATALNEGVPSVMIAGVTTQTGNVGIPFTAAYVVPEDIIVGNDSPNTSLLIHQRDSNSRAIVFHGGDTGIGDNYEQITPSNLSNIKLGTDDSLILSTLKPATAPSAQSDMLGLSIITNFRSQNYYADSDILMQSGQGASTQFGHGDFKINVGTAGNVGGNKFQLITTGTAGSTLLEAGNITLTTTSTQVGNWQLQSGEIRLVTLPDKSVNVYSGAGILLDAYSANPTTPVVPGAGNPLGFVDIRSNTGGVRIAKEGISGNISITANSTSASNASNIFIDNESTAPNNLNGGDIYIRTNSQTILRKKTASATASPSIVLDYTAGNGEHTRFVGRQTWSTTGTTGFSAPPADIKQYNNFAGLNNSNGIFRVSGGATTTDINPGFRFENWEAGDITATGYSTVNADAAVIALGKEDGPNTNTSPHYFGTEIGSDRTVTFATRDTGMNTSPSLEHFSANMNKTAIAGIYVLRRTGVYDDGSGGTGGNLNPFQLTRADQSQGGPSASFRSSDAGPSQTINTNNFPGVGQTGYPGFGTPFGFDFRSNVSIAPTTKNIQGMPTTEQLQPFMIISFGQSVGQKFTTTTNPYDGSAPTMDLSNNFPIGAYPGQRVVVCIDNYAMNCDYEQPNGTITSLRWFGKVRINIPQARTGVSQTALMTDDWYDDHAGGATNSTPILNDGRRNYQQFAVETTSGDASNNTVNSLTLEMIWDGTVTETWTQNKNIAPGLADLQMGMSQTGWRVLSSRAASNRRRIIG